MKNLKNHYLSLLFLSAFAITFLAADPAHPPTNLSLKGLAEWAEKGGMISSGTGALPAVASAGARYTDISTPSTPVDYRSNGSSWVAFSAGLTAHIASNTDPHGATETITQSLFIGTGTKNIRLFKIGTGTLGIASYVALVEESATPTETIATFTIWGDSNTGKVRIWDGAVWHDLY